MSELDWIDAEVDRRLRLQEQQRGVALPHALRHQIKRQMRRQMQHGLAAQTQSVERDQEEASHRGLAQRLVEAGLVAVEVYLRMGEPPGRGPSRSIFGYDEEGVSVFAGNKTVHGHYVLQLPNWALRADLIRFSSEDEAREAYFVRGRRVGTGSDGEPLLDEVWEVEPVPPPALVAVAPPSRALEEWNIRRGGPHVFKAREGSEVWA